MKLTLHSLTVLSVLSVTMPFATADVIFSNIVSTGTDAQGLVEVSGLQQSLAAAFIPSENYALTDAEVKVRYTTLDDPNFELSLFFDSGDLPGASLGVIGIGAATSTTGFTTVTVPSAALTLNAGTQYWLVMTPIGDHTVSGWASDGSPTATSVLYVADSVNGENGPWETGTPTFSLEFEVDGTLLPATPAPEPSTVAMLLSAPTAAGFFLLRNKRKAMRR